MHAAAPLTPKVDSPAAQGVQVAAPVSPRVDSPAGHGPHSGEKVVSPAGHGVHTCPGFPAKPAGQSPAVYQLGIDLIPEYENIDDMSVTAATSQLERSALNAEAL